jgi:hypothetical protein
MIRKFETPYGRDVVYTHYDSIAEMEHALVGLHNYRQETNRNKLPSSMGASVRA